MEGHLAFDLHALTSRLDRAADRILQAECDVSYRRFLVLFMTDRLEDPTQRALAERLGVTEPSISRMIAMLSTAGLLDVRRGASGGNRRGLRLTDEGGRLVQRCCVLLEDRMTVIVQAAGVPYDTYLGYTARLLDSPELA
jgi:DNA-binding MarR family transcriptional regulator